MTWYSIENEIVFRKASAKNIKFLLISLFNIKMANLFIKERYNIETLPIDRVLNKEHFYAKSMNNHAENVH